MARDLQLGLNTGYWAGGPPPGIDSMITEAERLGFDSMWTSEAYGSDCISPLAWWGSKTEKLRLGTAIMQMSARQPAAAAMAAMTMDHLSGGRFMLGIGVSGPQVVEGWYGMPFEKPLARTREYIRIMRDIWARQGPVTNDGPHYPLPMPGGTGLGKPLKSSIHPMREDIPIFLGCEGPKNIALCAEVCDGWMSMLFSPAHQDIYTPSLEEGWGREGARRGPDDFEVACMVPMIVADDVQQCADALRPFYALYFGGMGAKGKNFHANVPIRMGYEKEILEIQDLYLDGHKDEAAAKIPFELIEAMSLIGPKDKIRDDLAKWRESVVTQLMIQGDENLLRTAADLVLGG
jgi:F420-dependent oxidoreductase-like protein